MMKIRERYMGFEFDSTNNHHASSIDYFNSDYLKETR